METVFQTVLIMSIYGTLAGCIVWLILMLLRRTRCAKSPLLLLWAVVAFRLVCPWSPPSPVSVFNFTREIRQTSVTESTVAPEAPDEISRDDSDAYLSIPDTYHVYTVPVQPPLKNTSPQEASSAVYLPSFKDSAVPFHLLWLAGLCGLLIYTGLSYFRLKRRLRFAVKDEHITGVWYSEQVTSPCVVGFFRPRIYLTYGMSDTEKAFVLAHEQQHLRAGDHLWAATSWLILCVHWFNPLLWLLRRAFVASVEDACDQRVLRRMGEENRTDYSRALLALSSPRRLHPGPSPIAFGEGDTKKRIKAILKYRKPILGITAAAIILAAAVGICVVTDPERDAPAPFGDYQISGVLHLTLLSSSTRDYYFEQSSGTIVRLSETLFSVDGDGFISSDSVSSPIYEEMELGDTLPTFTSSEEHEEADAPLFEIDLPEGTLGWKVLTAEGKETGWHIFAVGDSVCVGKWITHGQAGTLSEYSFIIEVTPSTGKTQDMESAPTAAPTLTPTETQLPLESQWEKLTLTWYIPKGSNDPYTHGFPLCFSFPFDHFEASCAGGTPYTYRKGEPISGHPIEDANAAYLRWWPYEDGSTTPARSASVTATVYGEDGALVSCSLLFDLIGESADELTYSVRVTLHGSEDYVYSRSPENFGGKISPADTALPETLATFSADLTHNGVDETITIQGEYPMTDGLGRNFWDVYHVSVTDGSSRGLWSGSAGVPHVGQNGIYLYEEDGLSYLMIWSNYGISGSGGIYYRVFTLNALGEEIVRYSDSVILEFNDLLSADAEAWRAINEESLRLLAGSIVLASTNGDTPEREYYSTPEAPLSPILQYDTYYVWTADEIEAMQAKAQGTYTFCGAVASVFDDCILVEDMTLWAPDGYYVLLCVPVENPAEFSPEQLVQVTADGPLHLRRLPDEGTNVEVILLDKLPQ